MKPRFLLDSSIWIDVYRGKDTELSRDIGDLVLADEVSYCGFVLAELLRGARSDREFKELVENFSGLHYFEATPKVFFKASELGFQLRRKGVNVNLIDSLIAAIALLNNQTIITRDSDFERFPGLKVKMV